MLYVLPAAAVAPFLIADVQPNGRFDPALSPDGSRLAFASHAGRRGELDIYVDKLCSWPVVSCQGPAAPAVRLTTDAAADFGPAWSPDGSQIAFCRKTAGGAAILLIPTTGGAERKLSESRAGRPRLSWSPDGRFLAVADGVSSTGPAGVFAISIADGKKHRLTTAAPGSSGDDTPAFSPDGRSLAFSRTERGGPATIRILPLGNAAAPAGEPRRLDAQFDPGKPGSAISGLAWSPDGASILVTSAGLWKVPAAGGKAESLAKAQGEITSLSAARQGRRLVYAELVPEVELWRTAGPASKPEDFPPTRILGAPEYLGSPNVSRDGTRVAFGSFLSGTWEVWQSDRDGRKPVQTTFLGDVATGSPRWSPDGKHIVFDGRDPQTRVHDIFVVDAEGGPARRLTTDPKSDIRPSYSSDQRWIYFTSERSGTPQIWKMPTAGGAATQVTKNGGFIAFETLDGKYLYYGKGPGQTSLWRVPVSGGEEVKVLDDVNSGSFAVCDVGLCILNLRAKPRRAIEFYSFATQKRTPLAVLPEQATVLSSGTSLGVARDGRWLVYVQLGPIGSSVRTLEY
jgi:Tol biopolymer transport system component